MSPHSPSSNSAPYQLLKKMTGEAVTTTIDFVLPNMRLEEIHSGKMWFSSRATVTPVRRDLCRVDFLAGWDFPLFSGVLFSMFWETFFWPGEGENNKTGGGGEAPPEIVVVF